MDERVKKDADKKSGGVLERTGNGALNRSVRVLVALCFLLTQMTGGVSYAASFDGGSGSGDSVLDVDTVMFKGGSGDGSDADSDFTTDTYVAYGTATQLVFIRCWQLIILILSKSLLIHFFHLFHNTLQKRIY